MKSIGAWFNKKFVAKTGQPEETDDGPSPTEDFIEEQKQSNYPQDFTAYGGRNSAHTREGRFSDRGARPDGHGRDSFNKQSRQANNADRRRTQNNPLSNSHHINMTAQNRQSNLSSIQSTGMSSAHQSSQSPVKKARQTNTITMASQGGQELEYMPGELPTDFHRKVVDLEIKIEMHGVSQSGQNDNEGQIKLLSDLMQLYSAAIEHYNRTRDEENYAYYIEKLQKLNQDIRVLIEREERTLDRMKVRKQAKAEAKKAKAAADKGDSSGQSGSTKASSGATIPQRPQTTGTKQPNLARVNSVQPPRLSVIERKKMRHNFQMALATKAQEEEKTLTTQQAELEQQVTVEKEAKKKLEKDLVSQKDRLQQRLAERKRSRAFRATSQLNNQTLPLNFENRTNPSNNDNQMPRMQTSAMQSSQDQQQPEISRVDAEAHSPLKKSYTLKMDKGRNNDDTFSQGNRSTTTQGGGLANKIGQAVSRILSQTGNLDETDVDEAQDLVNLLNELNAHHDLTVKLSNQSKIMKFLNEASEAGTSPGAAKATPTVKDYKVTIGKAKSEFGRLGFQSKMRLEMKQMMIDPKVKEIVDQSKQKLEELQEQKEDEITEFQEEHAEAKYKANQKVKAKFKLQIARAAKEKDTEKKQELESQQKDELKKVEQEMQEKGVEGKNKIKERYNELSKQVTIDTAAFMSALLKKKELKKLNISGSHENMAEEESKQDGQDNLQLPDNIQVGIEKSSPRSPRQESQNDDTQESTPTPTQKSTTTMEQAEAKAETAGDSMPDLDNVNQINLE